MSLGNLAENIYNGNVSLDAAKKEQGRMENMLENLIDYSPVKNLYKNQRSNILLNAREFYKGRKEVIIAFGENMFPLPKSYVFGKNEWKERYLGKEEFMPKILKKSFLSELGYTPLSEKENELLNKHFMFEDIDESVEAFNNTETKEEYNKLFNGIINRAIIVKKLVKTVSNPVEKKNIKSIIKVVANLLNYFLNTHESKESDFSNDIEGIGLKILMPNQMLSRLPISLVQLKAGNNSKILKTKLGNYCTLCIDKKNLQNNTIKVSSTLFKTWKQFL